MSWNEYRGMRTVVTGSASGMGAATAALLVAAGAEVYGLDVQDVAAPGVTASRCDMTSESSIDAAVAALPDRIDAAFLCAGLSPSAPLDKVMLVNLFGNLRLIDALVPIMPRGAGIATVASLAAGWTESLPLLQAGLGIRDFAQAASWIETLREHAWDNGYMLSKHALIANTILASGTLAQTRGVRLNTLCPGKTDTPMMDQFRATVGEGLDALPVPLGRNSSPDEQAEVLMFMNSPRASYLVGAIIANDGGSDAALTAAALSEGLGAARS